MRNRVFFPQETLDLWIADDRVDYAAEELTLKAIGRRYKVVEAVRVLREVTGAADPHELIGRVKSRAFLAEFEAEIMEGSMIIGDNAYDVVQGFAAAPSTTFEEYQAEQPGVSHAGDFELLVAFVAEAG